MQLESTVPTLFQQQNDIMERFDFERVLKAMHALNWTWLGKTVTLEDLKRNAIYLMDTVSQRHTEFPKGWKSVATGGFEARVTEMNDGMCLSLAFCVSSVDAHMY
jgi:hypothetical protein